MVELYNMGISEKTIRSMLEIVPQINDMTSKEIVDKKMLLKKINCNSNQVINIISSNHQYLNRTNSEIINLI